MKKIRLDLLLIRSGFTDSRSIAQRLIMAGDVIVNGHVVYKPAAQVDPKAKIEIKQKPRYVSRGGEKLEAGLIRFGFENLADKVCADVGCSTGGFTDCLLQHGASKVYAVDVGQGVLHWQLRQDARVILYEKTNVRHLQKLPEYVSLITIDVSFISLKLVVPVVKQWLGDDGGDLIALIKPQFEAGRQAAAKGKGVIRSKEMHASILHNLLSVFLQEQLAICGLIQSPLKGPKGNNEFLVHLAAQKPNRLDVRTIVEHVLSGSK